MYQKKYTNSSITSYLKHNLCKKLQLHYLVSFTALHTGLPKVFGKIF